MSGQTNQPHGAIVVPYGGRNIEITVAAVYDEACWAWVAGFGGLPVEYGDPPTFPSPDPYRCIGEATAWLTAKFEGRDLPPAPIPLFVIKPAE